MLASSGENGPPCGVPSSLGWMLSPTRTPARRYRPIRLKLPVNEHKSKVAPIGQCVFLGFTFRGKKLCWSDAAFEDFKHRVRALTGRSWGVSMPHRLAVLAQYLRGWMGYFGLSQYYRPIPELDEWLRRRVRMCYWHLSCCLVTQVGMTVEWLKRQGLLSIRERWMKAQGYA